jgi:hypothetical protein
MTLSIVRVRFVRPFTPRIGHSFPLVSGVSYKNSLERERPRAGFVFVTRIEVALEPPDDWPEVPDTNRPRRDDLSPESEYRTNPRRMTNRYSVPSCTRGVI